MHDEIDCCTNLESQDYKKHDPRMHSQNQHAHIVQDLRVLVLTPTTLLIIQVARAK